MNQTIKVPDIAIVKTVDGTKKLLSLRDQKIKKGTLHNFGVGSGVKHNGDLYVLKETVPPIITMTTTRADFSFDGRINGNFEVDWGDGSRDKNTKKHTYTDGLGQHTISVYGNESTFTELYCNYKDLTSINIDGCKEISNLQIGGNPIDSVNLESIRSTLRELTVGGTNISQLNLTNFPLLWDLEAYGCASLKSLDITGSTEITRINIFNSKLDTLDVSNCAKLGYLDCSGNPISSLDLKNNTELGLLFVNNTDISEIDISTNKGAIYNIAVQDTPFETNEDRLVKLANELPDRTGSSKGTFNVSREYSSIVNGILEPKNWSVNTH